MKVLFLAPQPRGPNRLTQYSFLEEELQALSASGIQMHVLADGPRNPEVQEAVVVHRIPGGRKMSQVASTLRFLGRSAQNSLARPFPRPFRMLYHIARIEAFAADVVRDQQIDVIHSHFAWPGGFGGSLASADANVPLVATFRGMDLGYRPEAGYGLRLNPFFSSALQSVFRQASRMTYVSRFMRNQGLAAGATHDSSVVIPKGVDLRKFRPVSDRARLRSELGIDHPLILSVGGLMEGKGVEFTLQALARLKTDLDFSFVVCGEGAGRERLEALTRELNLAGRVRLLGYVPRHEIPRYFSAADVFVHSALWEAAGNVLLEAMASGRPAVCTAAGGPPEYVSDGETGFVVPIRDPARLSERIRDLLQSPDLADEMGANGRRRAEAYFSYEGMIERIVGVYREVMSLSGSSAAMPGGHH